MAFAGALASGCKPKKLEITADTPIVDKGDVVLRVTFSRGGASVEADRVEAGGETAEDPGRSHLFRLKREKLPVGKSTLEVSARVGEQKVKADVEIENPIGLKSEPGLLRCEGARSCYVRVKKKGEDEVFELHQHSEAGVVVEAAGHKVAHEKASTFDPLPFATGSRMKTLQVSVPVKILYAGAPPLEGKLTEQLHAPKLVAKQLRAVKKGPVHLAGESPTKGPAKGALLVYEGDLTAHGAPMTNNAEAEILGIVDITAERRSSCGTYSNGSVSRTLERIEWDTTVSVYERRSGKLLGTRAFRAPPIGCSATASKDSYSFYSKPDDATMGAFLKTFLQ